MSELKDSIAELIEDHVASIVPTPEAAYVSWSSSKNDFYVSTTDDDRFNGRISMEEIVNIFISDHECGDGGSISNKDSAQFIVELELAIKRIKERDDSFSIGFGLFRDSNKLESKDE